MEHHPDNPAPYYPFDPYSAPGTDNNRPSIPAPSDEAPKLRSAKRGGAIAFLFVAFLVFAFFISPLSDPIRNNRSLNRLENSFAKLKHPPQTALVHRLKDIGLLIGNSDHCDFFVGELRTYSGTPQQISNFYKLATVWSPISDNQQPLSEVVFFKQGKIPPEVRKYLPNSYQTNEDWNLDASMKHQQLYIVYFLDVGSLNAGCDIRCL